LPISEDTFFEFAFLNFLLIKILTVKVFPFPLLISLLIAQLTLQATIADLSAVY